MFRSVMQHANECSTIDVAHSVCSNVWSRATRHSLKEWVGSDALNAFLSRPTDQARKERVGGNATDPKLAAYSRSSSDVLASVTSHSPEKWVGG